MNREDFHTNMATLGTWYWAEHDGDWRLKWPGLRVSHACPPKYPYVVPDHVIVRVFPTIAGMCSIDTAATILTSSWMDIVRYETAWRMMCDNELLVRALLLESYR